MKYKQLRLGDLAEFTTGKLNANKAVEDGKYPFFTTSPETLRINNFAFDQDAILLGGNNANGVFQLKRYTGKFNAYQRTYVISVVKENIINNDYLYYALMPKLVELQNKSLGTATKFITKRILENLLIKVPNNYNEMERRATYLRTIDNKIQLNKQLNANLDELMSEIFKRYVTEANVFTTDSLSNIANYKNGLAMQRFRPNGADKGLPVLKIKELNQGFTDSSSDRCSSKISNDVIVKTGDIIFSWSGTLIVKIWTGTTCGLNQHLFKVTSDKYPKWFIYKWTEYYLRQFQSIAAGKATTMGHIKRSDLKQAEVKIPHKSEIDRLDKLISPIFKRYVNNILEINSLKELKNELLSKIF